MDFLFRSFGGFQVHLLKINLGQKKISFKTFVKRATVFNGRKSAVNSALDGSTYPS